MGQKKNIDRLFQEKFKDFEQQPDPVVWQNIEQRLNKKKKQRIIPLWWRWAGAAAILLLLSTTAYRFFYSEKKQNDFPQNQQEQIIVDNNAAGTPKENDKSVEDNVKTPTTVAGTANENEKQATEDVHVTTGSVTLLGNARRTTVQNAVITSKNEEKTVISDANEQFAAKEKIENVVNTEITEVPVEAKIADVDNAAKNEQETNESNITNEVIIADNQKNDIQQELNNKATELEDFKKADKKWSVGSTVSPIYYGSVSDGSPIDPSLADNGKNSMNTLAYGLKVNYKINDKLSIQSGIQNVEMGYTTKNVTTFISAKSFNGPASNIDTNINGIQVDAAPISLYDAAETSAARSSFGLYGNMDQKLGYVEIPLEAKYSLLDRKFGINLVGGVSSYILYNNTVTLNSNNQTTTLGEASNINPVNFSGNLGVDFDYDLSKKLYINISPTFKYQLNTFSENSGGFKPYLFGIYTGLNFRF